MTDKKPGRQAIRVKTGKKRKVSSRKWLERQLNDPYVDKAQAGGYRSRAAFKLIEMNEKLKLLKPGRTVIDLGAAPGGWSQVAAEHKCRVIALDILPMDPLPGVDFIELDFMDERAPDVLKQMAGGQVEMVLSDIAPNTIGHRQTDHIRIMALVEAAYDFALEVLKPDGAFLAKVFQGGAENTLLARMKQDFRIVRHIKPPASRKESSEQYVVATGFRRQG